MQSKDELLEFALNSLKTNKRTQIFNTNQISVDSLNYYNAVTKNVDTLQI